MSLVSSIPVVRDYQATPTTEGVQKIGAAAKDAAQATGVIQGDPSDRWVRHAIEAPGCLFGLPTGQAAGGAQFLWDVWQGQEDPQGIADWRRGLMYGPAVKGR